MISVEGVSPFLFLPQWIALVFHTQLCFFSYSLVLIFFIKKVEPCTVAVRWGLRANKLPSSFLCMSSHNWNQTIIFSNMVLHFGSTRKCTLRDIQTLCNYNTVMPRFLKENGIFLFYFWRRKWYWLRWYDI